MSSRWLVHVIANDNGTIETFGAWRSAAKAKQVSDQIAAKSSYYEGADQPLDVTVQISYIQRWPGIRAFLRGE